MGAAFGEGALGFYASRGLVTKAVGTQEAAAAMGVAEDVLLEQVRMYQGKRGADRSAWAEIDADSAVWYVALVTPVVHYTMGGLAIDERARVLDGAGRPIEGLFAAGEAAGGVHGANRLGGNSLLECAVFGRVAGREAAQIVRESSRRSGID